MKPTDHCPRYFAHWIDLRNGVRLTFGSALLVPLFPSRALIFQADGLGYYALREAPRAFAPVAAIQYAITVVDEKRGVLHEEKFNHPFAADDVELALGCGGWFSLTCSSRRLYESYLRNEVLEMSGSSRQKVLQFVA